MLTAEPAAVRRMVGELDFRLAMKAFKRTCASKNPEGETPTKLIMNFIKLAPNYYRG